MGGLAGNGKTDQWMCMGAIGLLIPHRRPGRSSADELGKTGRYQTFQRHQKYYQDAVRRKQRDINKVNRDNRPKLPLLKYRRWKVAIGH